MVSLMDHLIGSSVIVTPVYVNCNLCYMTSSLTNKQQPCVITHDRSQSFSITSAFHSFCQSARANNPSPIFE